MQKPPAANAPEFFLSPGFFHSANCRQQKPRRYVTSDTLEEIMRHCREFRKNGK